MTLSCGEETLRFLRAEKEVVQTNHIVEDTEFYHSVREVVSVFK